MCVCVCVLEGIGKVENIKIRVEPARSMMVSFSHIKIKNPKTV